MSETPTERVYEITKPTPLREKHDELPFPLLSYKQLKALRFNTPGALVSYISGKYGIPEEAFSITERNLVKNNWQGSVGISSILGAFSLAMDHDGQEGRIDGPIGGKWALTNNGLKLLLRDTKDELAFDNQEMAATHTVEQVREAIERMKNHPSSYPPQRVNFTLPRRNEDE